MKRRGLISVLLLGFGLVSLVNAQDSKMEKESKMEKDSKMQMDSKMKKESKMEKDSKMQMDSKMEKESKMQMDSKMKKESKMEKDSKMQKESEMQMDSKMQKDSKMHEGSMMKEVALHEYCPVAYLAAGKAVKGDAMYSSTYKGKTYYFVEADAKKLFDATPAKYLPKYDGYCATAMAMGKKIESDPEIFSVHKGATYLFSSKEAKAAFDSDPNGTIINANKHFAAKAKM
jgi:YHS domain-containing protein